MHVKTEAIKQGYKKMAKTLSEQRLGYMNPAWKGGKCIRKDGYVLIWEYDPNKKRMAVYEHRYLMEKKLKRKLKKNEEVHHINKVKHDNKLSNLQLITRAKHNKIEPRNIKRGY